MGTQWQVLWRSVVYTVIWREEVHLQQRLLSTALFSLSFSNTSSESYRYLSCLLFSGPVTKPCQRVSHLFPPPPVTYTSYLGLPVCSPGAGEVCLSLSEEEAEVSTSVYGPGGLTGNSRDRGASMCGWGCGSMVKHLCSIFEAALGSCPAPGRKGRRKGGRETAGFQTLDNESL